VPYIEIALSASQDLADQCVALLSQLGFEGFWETETELKGYIRSDRWSPALHDEVLSTLRMLVRSSADALPTVRLTTLPDQNWNETWEKTIRPIHVTGTLVIRPTWQPYTPLPQERVIIIDPKMSFGTGYHESTRLVLRLLENHILHGSRVLDIGTGTGILAIAAVQLGAAAAVGTDIDEWSITNARENVLLNDAGETVTISESQLTTFPAGSFGMVLANIQRNVILTLLPEIVRLLAPGGIAIFSGLLRDDRDEILTSYSQFGFSVVQELSENEWIAFVATPQASA
jgi:ribosomal protein L11 methyltransferase